MTSSCCSFSMRPGNPVFARLRGDAIAAAISIERTRRLVHSAAALAAIEAGIVSVKYSLASRLG